MGIKQGLLGIYDKHYKKLMVFSFLLLFACMGVLINSYIQTGDLFEKGVSLKGGITLTIPVEQQVNTKQLERSIQEQYPQSDLSIKKTQAAQQKLIIEAADITEEEVIAGLKDNGIEVAEGSYNVRKMGTRFSDAFFKQTVRALLYAFIAMAIVVFITFRSLVPSSFVILAAVSDIISTLAVINLLGVRLSIAGAAAFLMLIGYSVDTDILLTTTVLKRKTEGGTTFQRTVKAMKTGAVITAAALSASIVGLIFSQSETVKQIMLVITIGLAFDALYTWLQNAGILRYYLERKENGQD